MKCLKCGLEMFSRPIITETGDRIENFECKNPQCENYIPDKKPETQIEEEANVSNV